MFNRTERWLILNSTEDRDGQQMDVDRLLDEALQRLADTGIQAELPPDADSGTDIRLFGPTGDRRYELQLKARISAESARAVTTSADRSLLVVAPYVPKAAADVLRRNDIHYIDAAGNMYVRWDGLLIDVWGHRRKLSISPEATGRPARMFKSAGLKVLFLLLCEPTAADRPYRIVAAQSGASLGTVQGVFQELDEGGYLDAERRTLHRTRELFDRWVEAYILNLWPTLTIARYTAPDPTWWMSADDSLSAFGAQWGGESAAHRLNPHLRPGSAVIYASSTLRDLILAQRFRKADGAGNVEIRHRFWSFTTTPPTPIVPIPLVYADLIASADPRQREAAADLREHDAVLGRIDRS
jgi:hypothetical protein